MTPITKMIRVSALVPLLPVLLAIAPQARALEKELPASRPSATRESQEEPPVAQSPEEHESRLTKNWGGARTALSDAGFDLALIYKGNLQRNFAGGINPGTEYLGNVDLRVSLDAEKLIGVKGGSFFFYGLATHGGQPSRHIGNLQGTNNVENAVRYQARLYEAWYQQLFEEERLSLLVGLHDLNSEFYVTDASGIFLNPSFGIGPELAFTGVNGPSIFPNTSMAARFRVEPSKAFYLQTAAFGGRAGDPEDPRGTHVRLNADDGFLLISEFAYLRGQTDSSQQAGKYAVGAWTYSTAFDHLVDVTSDGTAVKDASSGAYFLAEQSVNESVSLFLRYGVASTQVNQIGSALQAGVLFSGLLPEHFHDQLGLGLARANNGNEYLRAQELAGTPALKQETLLEATYRLELIPGIAVQPDYQLILNPNTDPNLKTAHVGTLRFQLNL